MDVAPFIQQIQKSLEEISNFQGNTAARIEEIAKDISDVVKNQKEFEVEVTNKISQVCARVDILEQRFLIEDTKKNRDKAYLIIISALATFIFTSLGILVYLYQLGGKL